MAIRRLMRLLLAFSLALAVAACAGNLGRQLPTWAGGEPAAAPTPTTPATAQPARYPNVYDLPPPRPTKLISDKQQVQDEEELSTLQQKLKSEGETVRRQRLGPPASSQ